MRSILQKYFPLYAPEGGDGAGSGAGAANTGGGGEGAGADVSGAEAAGGAAAAPGANGAAAELYRPNGIAETMFGKTDHETIDKMATSLNGYRNKLDNLPKAPKDFNDYTFGENSPEHLKTYLGNLEKDPIWDGIRVNAMKHNFSTDQFSGFVTDTISEWAEAGMLAEVVNDDEERAALLPVEAQYLTPDEKASAINERMQDNYDWLERVGPQHGITEEMGEFLIENIGDRAKGHQAIEVIRKMADGVRPLMGGGDVGGKDLPTTLATREADPRNNPGSQKYSQSYAEETRRMWQMPGATGQ